jgi:UDP-2,3-diacylglucosamine pyrophosphatase LpxH
MWEVSLFDKDPRMGADLASEIDEAREWLELLSDKLPETRKIFIYGNHEYRLHRYIMRNAPALVGLPGMSLAEMLNLNELRYKVINSDLKENFFDTGNGLLVGHFNKANKHSGYTVKNLVEQYGVSLIQGHVHRLGMHAKRTFTGTIYGYENGCLCDINPNYIQHPNWQQGFSIINWDRNEFFIEQIPIQDGRFFYRGELFE